MLSVISVGYVVRFDSDEACGMERNPIRFILACHAFPRWMLSRC